MEKFFIMEILLKLIVLLVGILVFVIMVDSLIVVKEIVQTALVLHIAQLTSKECQKVNLKDICQISKE